MTQDPICRDIYLAKKRRIQLNPIGEIDEKHYIPDLIKQKFKNQKIALVSLGIGRGRELEFLHQIEEIDEFYGLDISTDALRECREFAKMLNIPDERLHLFEDTLFDLQHWKNYIQVHTIKKPILYTLLLNTLGVFDFHHRVQILKTLRETLREEDAILLTLYKLPKNWDEVLVENLDPSLHNIKDPRVLDTARYLYFDRPYIREDLLGHVFIYYNPSTTDVEVYKFRKPEPEFEKVYERFLKGERPQDAEKIFSTHRWGPGEVEKLLEQIGIKTETIEGKYMYIVWGKLK